MLLTFVLDEQKAMLFFLIYSHVAIGTILAVIFAVESLSSFVCGFFKKIDPKIAKVVLNEANFLIRNCKDKTKVLSEYGYETSKLEVELLDLESLVYRLSYAIKLHHTVSFKEMELITKRVERVENLTFDCCEILKCITTVRISSKSVKNKIPPVEKLSVQEKLIKAERKSKLAKLLSTF
jgi:hypothetical protein